MAHMEGQCSLSRKRSPKRKGNGPLELGFGAMVACSCCPVLPWTTMRQALHAFAGVVSPQWPQHPVLINTECLGFSLTLHHFLCPQLLLSISCLHSKLLEGAFEEPELRQLPQHSEALASLSLWGLHTGPLTNTFC